jgi:hypothetical protein
MHPIDERMPVTTILNTPGVGIGELRVPESVTITIHTRVIAPVVPTEIGPSYDVGARCLRDVPYIVSIVKGIITIYEIIIVNNIII